MVNRIRKPREWSVYDIVFESSNFERDKLLKPKQLNGNTAHRILPTYKPHADEPLLLPDHGHSARYRKIWVRLAGYYQPEKQ